MIRYIPKPLPDETLYSLVARYQEHTLSIAYKSLAIELFGKNIEIGIDLPSNISTFSKNTFHLLRMSDTEIIDQLTIWPYFSHFISREDHSYWIEALKGDKTRDFARKSGLNSSNISRVKLPHYCTSCNNENFSEFGEMYWKRIHQIPNILICPKHNCLLKSAYIGSDYSRKKVRLIAASKETCIDTIVEVNQNNLIYEFAQKMERLLSEASKKDTDYDVSNYKELAFKYYSKGSIIEVSRMLSEMTQFFGEDTLHSFQKTHRWSEGKFFNRDSIRKKYIINPLTHLMFSEFFNTRNHETKPVFFDIKSMVCINPVGGHGDKFETPVTSIRYSKKRKEYYGSFCCSCGMKWKVYRGIKGAVSKPEIIDFGIKWKSQFYEEVALGQKNEMIAEKFKISIPDVIRKSKRKSKFKAFNARIEKKNLSKAFKQDSYRKTWKSALKNHPNLKIRDLAKIAYKEYNWLSLNDQEWLRITHATRVKTQSTGGNRYDYTKLDKDLSERIKNTYKELVETKFGMRITKTTLLKASKIMVGLKTISKLPDTAALISKYSETIEDKRLRLS